MPKHPTIINPDAYSDAADSNTGWCTYCEDFTNEGIEPDADGVQCDVCENPTVYGAEQALLLDLIEF